VNAIDINASTDMFHFEMNNCTIQYNKAQFIHVDIICTKQTQIEPQVVFKNCNF